MILDAKDSSEIEATRSKLGSAIQTNFNNVDNIIQFKIVYWGPGESGKTTNFMRLREKFSSIRITNGYSVETTDGRTL